MTGTAVATIDTRQDRLHCTISWLVTFTAVTSIALTLAAWGLVVVLLTQGPKLAMNISTMIEDNQYCNVAGVASHMDDGDRSRLLQDLTVRIGDVAPGEAVGHIAVSTVDVGGDGTIVGQMKEGRLYD